MVDADMLSFVLKSLPPPPARVLEVGAGNGDLAGTLGDAGYEVLAIDPASAAPAVQRVSLHELTEPAASFDAAVAVLSLHHVEPLKESCARLASVLRGGGVLVLDEIDFERLDERAAQWWLDQRAARADQPGATADEPGVQDGETSSAAQIVAHHRDHCHLLPSLGAALDEWFELTPPLRGPYLYRWNLGPELRDAEVELIERGELPATGVRLVGVRE